MRLHAEKFLFVNGNSWATSQAVWEYAAQENPVMLPAAFGVAETRLHGSGAREAAKRWMAQRGYLLHQSGATATGSGGAAVGPSGGAATSAGVALAVTARWPSRRLKLPNLELFGGMVVLVQVDHPKIRGGLVMGTVYLHSGDGWGTKNLELLAGLGAEILALERPFLLMGDWNLEGFQFVASGWAERLGAHVLRPVKSTCSAGAGGELDFMVASSILCGEAEEVTVLADAPASPNSPV